VPTPRRWGPGRVRSATSDTSQTASMRGSAYGSKYDHDGRSGGGSGVSSGSEGIATLRLAPALRPETRQAETRIRTPSPEDTYYSWRGREPAISGYSPISGYSVQEFMPTPEQMPPPGVGSAAQPEGSQGAPARAAHGRARRSFHVDEPPAACTGSASSSPCHPHAMPASRRKATDAETSSSSSDSDSPGLVSAAFAQLSSSNAERAAVSAVTTPCGTRQPSRTQGPAVGAVEAPSIEASHACHAITEDVPSSWPSPGSIGHPACHGPPCKYHTRGRGCKDGDACSHCHLCVWKPTRDKQRHEKHRDARQRKQTRRKSSAVAETSPPGGWQC